MLFRKDINGLRALAVISVVIFHFSPSWLPGGFAGVDVFFVISGFLMTGIIFRGIENDNFSILKFYLSRANRIIPALAFLCLFLMVFGWFYITPLDYTALGKHVASSISFISNMTYWREAGYFDIASKEKWLLHTWSLSVEWQFYILYPIALVALKKFLSVEKLKLVILIGLVLGFLISVAGTYKAPTSSYYLLPTRIWEMLAGGVAYLYPLKGHLKHKKVMEWVGLSLIIGSYIFISKLNPWPGYLALFPVLGTFIYIQSQTTNNIVTNNPVSQKIGTWSYSIYLWHWPLVVAIHYYSLNSLFTYLGIAASVALGFLSYTFIEGVKFRQTPLLQYRSIAIGLVALVCGVLVFKTDGFEWHYPPSVVQADKESLNRNPYKCMDSREDFGPCYIGNKDNIKAIIAGDSHADALATSLSSTLDLKKEGIIALSVSSCPLILDAQLTKYTDVCYDANKKRMSYLSQNHDGIPVFWVARTPIYFYGLSSADKITDVRDVRPLLYFTEKYETPNSQFFAELKSKLEETILGLKKNHAVYMVHPTPEMIQNIPKKLSRGLILKNDDIDLSVNYESFQEKDNLVRKLLNEVSLATDVAVLDPIPYLCPNGRCIAQHGGRPIYYDNNHLSEFGNKLLTPMFKPAMASFHNQQTPSLSMNK